MPATYQIFFGEQPADQSFYDQLTSLEVEENADLPGAIQFVLPISASRGDLTYVNDCRIGPFARLGVVATPQNGTPEWIFIGNVLTHRLHLESGAVASKLEVWGQDASWLMNLEEKVREWPDVKDSDIADTIFGQYGITPAPENSPQPPSTTLESRSLMQRATDIAFLRERARATGKLCRVIAKNQPGQLLGYFARPNLQGDPVLTLDLNCNEKWTVDSLDLDVDVSRPTSVNAQQLFPEDTNGRAGIANESIADLPASGLPLLDSQSLQDFSGQITSVILTAPSNSTGELALRARALLEDANWFVRCEGVSDVARLRAVLRVGTIVALQGIGSLHSGKYLVWSVRHIMTADSHKMRFVLVRNAVGPKSSNAPNGFAGGL